MNLIFQEENSREKEIITVIGAGGKTTCINFLSRHYQQQGKKVLVTTTTHMMLPQEGGYLEGDQKTLCSKLRRQGYVMAGMRCRDGQMEKMGPLPPDVLELGIDAADVTLIEGDGSKRRPLKAPAAHEPVIHPRTNRILLVAGLSAVGHPVQEICHRPEIVREILKCTPEHRITPQDVARILKEGYLDRLHREWKEVPVTVVFNQADTPLRRRWGNISGNLLEGVSFVIASLAFGYTYDSIEERDGNASPEDVPVRS